jgi:putative ABC transport system permease protein
VTRLALRGLAARKLRTTLTVLAVLLGVTMIAGTFVLTDTIRSAFDNLFAAGTRGADAVVSAREAVETEFGQPRPLEQATLDKIAQLPQVAKVAGQLNDTAAVIGKDGKLVKTGGAPTFAATYMPKPFAPIDIETGKPPSGPGEIALDANTAEKQDFKVGDTVRVAAGGPTRPYKLVGLATFGSQSSLGGATAVIFDLATAQVLFDKRGKVDFAYVAGREGQSEADVARAVRTVLPAGAQVRTAEAQAKSEADEIGQALSFITTALLAFAFIAVLVGAFLIFNTFSITVAQRSSELALLRTLGATRRQVLNSVLLEALAIGVAGSVVGIVAGLGFAKGINALFVALGIDLPTTSTVLEPRTIIVCLLVGTIVTLLGAVMPALRATRVSPVEALREASAPTTTRFARLVPYIAGLLMLLGIGLVLWGLLAESGDTTTKLIGAAGGAVLLILGVALMSPRFIRPVAGVVAWPLERSTALVGRLARENSTRNPARTAVTSAALMIGLALVLFVTIFANGLRVSVENIIDRSLAGDVAVMHDDGFSPIPAGITQAVENVPGVAEVSATKATQTKLRGVGGTVFTKGIDPTNLRSVYKFDWVNGSDATLSELGNDGAILEEDTAAKGGFKVGDRVPVTGPSGEITVTVRGIYRDKGLFDGAALPLAAFDQLVTQPRLDMALVKLDKGVNAAATQRGIDKALAPFPEARARNQQEIKDEQGDQISQILSLFYALLAMSVIISVFGIVNTLTLSIFERTREFGLLRAVGMTRRSVRRMVRYESIITAVFGALLGLLLGIFFAFVVVLALESEGLVFSLPIGQVVSFLIFAIVVGIVAAILPAYRASRLDVLRAISYE